MRSFSAILTIVIVALMVREAKSQHYIDRNGTYLTSVPNPYYTLNGGMMRGATWAHIVADGGREATAQETADWQAAQDAAALAAAEAAAQAEIDRQAAKPLKLKAVENRFFELCQLLFGDMEKRGFAALSDELDAMSAVDPQAAMVLSIKLLGIDAEGKREGGLNWWDDAIYHGPLED